MSPPHSNGDSLHINGGDIASSSADHHQGGGQNGIFESSERASFQGLSPTGPDMDLNGGQHGVPSKLDTAVGSGGELPFRRESRTPRRDDNLNGEYAMHDDDHNRDESTDNVPSNEFLLSTAFFSFMSFALLQLVFAFVAGSQAMMGDSAAMIVDALTYLFNWIAERKKNRFDAQHHARENEEVCIVPVPTATVNAGPGSSAIITTGGDASAFIDDEAAVDSSSSIEAAAAARRQRQRNMIHERTKRKMVLQLEIVPPIISVTTLAVVTVVVTQKAVKVLILDLHRDPSQQQRPNVTLMLAFSTLNLFLDGLNVFCFARAKHLMGYSVVDTTGGHGHGHDGGDEDIDTAIETYENGDHENGPHDSLSGKHSTRRNPKHHTARHFPLGTSPCEEGGLCDDANGDSSVPLQTASVAATTVAATDRGNHDANGSVEQQQYAARTARNSNGARTVDHHHATRGHGHHGNHDDDDDHGGANLNMCSAYTHVFADTLRSIAVIIAAITAELVPQVTPEEADATAAVIVSVLIVLSLIPLIQGLVRSMAELRAIRAQERLESDRLLLDRSDSANFEMA